MTRSRLPIWRWQNQPSRRLWSELRAELRQRALNTIQNLPNYAVTSLASLQSGHLPHLYRCLKSKLTANYTWSHTVDNISPTFTDGYAANYQLRFNNGFAPTIEKGNADYNVTSRCIFVVCGICLG